ncbi:cyclase family protein [Pseudonocardia sp. GCM10023141]|uniref:cyclase family protein n=1 Tax=Pseudonocardia sp. GCM10023141 TaxID=3252653 RepID=UPI0036212AEB
MTDPHPAYTDLPPAPAGGRSAWAVFADPDVGALTLQTPERIAAAARLVRKGAMFALQAPLDVIDPGMFTRSPPRHTRIVRPGARSLDDVIDNFFPQVSSQWDALGHVGYRPGEFFGGATLDDLAGGSRSVRQLAERGIAGRGVLLDAEAVLPTLHPDYHPGASFPITPDDLEACREAAGLTYRRGDVLVLNSGFLRWYRDQPAAAKAAMAPRDRLTTTGIEHTERMAEYLWNAGISAIVSDLPATETWPPDESVAAEPFGFLHRILLGQLGIVIGELFHLQDLVDDSRADGVHESFLVGATLNIAGAVGSTANALALK